MWEFIVLTDKNLGKFIALIIIIKDRVHTLYRYKIIKLRDSDDTAVDTVSQKSNMDAAFAHDYSKLVVMTRI